MSKSRSRNRHGLTIDLLADVSEEDLPQHIFGRLTTPTTIDKYVTQFCTELSLKEPPAFLKVQPPSWSRLNYCNKNVEKMMQLYGGSMKIGYKIWYVTGLYIEAERHAVWLNPAQELIDITFNKDGEENILFLPSKKLGTVTANAATKPRKAFHLRVKNLIEQQIHAEQLMSYYTMHDNTWDGWEKAMSYEQWLQTR